MKFVMMVILGVLSADWALAERIDQSKNTYACQIWEPNRESVDVKVDPNNQIYLHTLQDGMHEVEIHWWHWTLNVSVMKKGQIPEVLGAASHTNLKLRSHGPDVSIWCDKVDAEKKLVRADESCRTDCQVWYPMPRNCQRICD